MIPYQYFYTVQEDSKASRKTESQIHNNEYMLKPQLMAIVEKVNFVCILDV